LSEITSCDIAESLALEQVESVCYKMLSESLEQKHRKVKWRQLFFSLPSSNWKAEFAGAFDI